MYSYIIVRDFITFYLYELFILEVVTNNQYSSDSGFVAVVFKTDLS